MVAVRSQSFPVPLLLTPQKAADLIGISRNTLTALLKTGKVKAKRVAKGQRYFVTASLMQYLATLADA